MRTEPEGRHTAVIIDDDSDLRELLQTVLIQSGFETILAANGSDGIEAVRRHDPALTTLDVSMPGMDGFATAKRIREFSNTYLLMLSALGDEIDIVQGFEAGADDYIVKPFRPRELRARIDSGLRRASSFDDRPAMAPAEETPSVLATADTVPPPEVKARSNHRLPVPSSNAGPAVTTEPENVEGSTHFKGIELNVSMRTVTVDELTVELTRSEFDLLATLIGSRRRVRSKADLTLTLRGESYVTSYLVNEADKRAIEVHMTNLRRKIGDSSTSPRWIETVRGVGYRLAADN